MPHAVDPSRTTANHDPHASASGHRDGTAPASPPTGAAAGPRFGPPAAAGEAGVLGPYRILKGLGKGGMGAVYLARDTRLDRKLALKVMLRSSPPPPPRRSGSCAKRGPRRRSATTTW